MSRGRALPPSRPATSARSVLGLRDVEADDLGAVPCQRPGDGGADAAGGAGDQRGAAGERARPVVRCGVPGRADLDDLAADERGPRGEQEAQGGFGGVGRPRCQPQELSGSPLAEFLAQGADEALQRLLGGGLMVVQCVGHGAQDDDARVVVEFPYDGVQRGVHLAEGGHVGDPGRVQDDAGVAGARGAVGVHRQARTGEDGGRVGGGPACGQVEYRPVQAGVFGAPAAQRRGLRQAESAGEESAGAGIGETKVVIGHWPTPGPRVNLLRSKVTVGSGVGRGCGTGIGQPAAPSGGLPSSGAAGSRSRGRTAPTPPRRTRACSPRRSTAWSSGTAWPASRSASSSRAPCSSTAATSTSPARHCSAPGWTPAHPPTTSNRRAAPGSRPSSRSPTRSR